MRNNEGVGVTEARFRLLYGEFLLIFNSTCINFSLKADPFS